MDACEVQQVLMGVIGDSQYENIGIVLGQREGRKYRGRDKYVPKI